MSPKPSLVIRCVGRVKANGILSRVFPSARGPVHPVILAVKQVLGKIVLEDKEVYALFIQSSHALGIFPSAHMMPCLVHHWP